MNPLVHYGLTIAAGVLAWGVSRNFDGPVVHIAITLAVMFIAWSMLNKMGV